MTTKTTDELEYLLVLDGLEKILARGTKISLDTLLSGKQYGVTIELSKDYRHSFFCNSLKDALEQAAGVFAEERMPTGTINDYYPEYREALKGKRCNDEVFQQALHDYIWWAIESYGTEHMEITVARLAHCDPALVKITGGICRFQGDVPFQYVVAEYDGKVFEEEHKMSVYYRRYKSGEEESDPNFIRDKIWAARKAMDKMFQLPKNDS